MVCCVSGPHRVFVPSPEPLPRYPRPYRFCPPLGKLSIELPKLACRKTQSSQRPPFRLVILHFGHPEPHLIAEVVDGETWGRSKAALKAAQDTGLMHIRFSSPVSLGARICGALGNAKALEHKTPRDLAATVCGRSPEQAYHLSASPS
ncbi:hypothetical protein HOK31_28155 [Candidatus Poribacteria bacterium]|nr:hypothetical protein [Candidatus Poribacteria bacterium]